MKNFVSISQDLHTDLNNYKNSNSNPASKDIAKFPRAQIEYLSAKVKGYKDEGNVKVSPKTNFV